MNNLGKRNLFNRFISFICITIMISSILIIAIASSYTVLIEDDYWHGNDVGAFHVGFWNYLIAS